MEMTMKLLTAILAVALIVGVPALAFAQTTQQGARDGAAAGGAVGGPVGGAVGGAVGAAVGLGLEIPNAVISSITGANRPSVIYERPIVVGEPLPSEVEMYEVPGHAEYRYAHVNNKRYIIESRSRRVVRVID
jgi:uncharacterized protein DUF1236